MTAAVVRAINIHGGIRDKITAHWGRKNQSLLVNRFWRDAMIVEIIGRRKVGKGHVVKKFDEAATKREVVELMLEVAPEATDCCMSRAVKRRKG